MIPFNKNCGSCALYNSNAKSCAVKPIFNGKMEPNDYCSKHMSQIYVCEICGQGLLYPYLNIRNGEIHVYCENHISAS